MQLQGSYERSTMTMTPQNTPKKLNFLGRKKAHNDAIVLKTLKNLRKVQRNFEYNPSRSKKKYR